MVGRRTGVWVCKILPGKSDLLAKLKDSTAEEGHLLMFLAGFGKFVERKRVTEESKLD